MKWEFINTGFHGGRYNMAFDRMLASALADGTGKPTLRFYGWNPPSISLGFHQDETDFDSEKLLHEGVDIVRRPTGGRAILHWHELTYSVVMEFGDETPKLLYAYINRALLHGLKLMRISGELSGANDHFPSLYREPSSIPCFSTSAKNEIHVGGKKIIGSAQRRFGNALLQHGSFLLGRQHRRLIDFLAPHLDASRAQLEETFISKTIEAEEILQRPVSFDEAAEAFKRGFEMEWEVEFGEMSFLSAEMKVVGGVAET